MKRICAFIALIMLANYAFAKLEIWKVVHNETWSKSGMLDDGNEYVVKPVGNGHCLHLETMPGRVMAHVGNKLGEGIFVIDFLGNIFCKCGYEHSSQDFEVHSLTDHSLSATFQWYSPYGKKSHIRALNDPHHIVMAVTGPRPRTIYIGKWVDPPE
ncbi:hypothetical protein [Candidatus Sororendozoicomonas aggregata]|uniref:hypothetical protein n=1 Tax=Candidatus Sororendozoicomonas aggregata TaxID=3073239 RepID=UPI002ED25138